MKLTLVSHKNQTPESISIKTFKIISFCNLIKKTLLKINSVLMYIVLLEETQNKGHFPNQFRNLR